jgi:ABC-type multidrug transport system ATPase subunit
MALLSLEAVTKRYRHGRRERVVLHDVSLEVDSGEVVAVLGRRRSGRTTFLRVAGGLVRPDQGVVRFGLSDLARSRMSVIGRELGFVHGHMTGLKGERIFEHVAIAGAATGISWTVATARAESLLRQVGAERCVDLFPQDLDPGEAVRVSLARALIAEPRVLLVDEPTKGISLAERDSILRLVRSIADAGVGVLMTVGEATELAGADRALNLSEGRLRGEVLPAKALVLPLRRAASDA